MVVVDGTVAVDVDVLHAGVFGIHAQAVLIWLDTRLLIALSCELLWGVGSRSTLLSCSTFASCLRAEFATAVTVTCKH